MSGETTKTPFGHKFRDAHFKLAKGYTNVNHGSYGLAPAPVLDFISTQNALSNARPDFYARFQLPKLVAKAQEAIEDFVNSDRGDIVLLDNATTGVFTALNSVVPLLNKNDQVLSFDITYPGVRSGIQYLITSNLELSLKSLQIPIDYPITHPDLIKKIEEIIKQSKAEGKRIGVALIDAINANPGVVMPYKELVALFKKEGIPCVVDGAHAVGQIPLNLSELDPDFFISNAHKWLMAHRGCAFLYVAKRYQYLVHPFPVGYEYKSRQPVAEGTPDWQAEFMSNGVHDRGPLLSLLPALEFRKNHLPSEEAIYEYCHNLALQAGEVVRELLGDESEVLQTAKPEEEGDLIACMANVRIPVLNNGEEKGKGGDVERYLTIGLVVDYDTFLPIFPYKDAYYIRLSAQVYNEIGDYEFVGKALQSMVAKIKDGSYKGELKRFEAKINDLDAC